MKISKPSIQVMQEYLLYYGEEWVKKQYDMSGDAIDNLLYGAKIPTQEQQERKLRTVAKEDSDTKAYILSMYANDHFIWDEPNSKHLKCLEGEEKPIPDWTEEFLKKWSNSYTSTVRRDMLYHQVNHGDFTYVVPSRTINKTTSMDTLDYVQNEYLSFLLNGELAFYATIDSRLSRRFNANKSGHGKNNEDFLENIENNDLSNLNFLEDDREGNDY